MLKVNKLESQIFLKSLGAKKTKQPKKDPYLQNWLRLPMRIYVLVGLEVRDVQNDGNERQGTSLL